MREPRQHALIAVLLATLAMQVWVAGTLCCYSWTLDEDLYRHALGTTSLPEVREEVIVGLRAQPSESYEQLLRKHNGITAKHSERLRARLLRFQRGKAADFVEEARKSKLFRYVEYNEKNRVLAAVVNDPNYTLQWNLERIQVQLAWDTQLGDGSLIVSVIDTGIDYNHVDLASNYRTGGYDWFNDDNDPWDDRGHGTHVAGIIAAVTNNSKGVAGIAQVKVMAEKVFSPLSFAGDYDAAQAIAHAVDAGARIINLSWGGYTYSEILKDAVAYASSKRVMVIAAAGNDNTNQPFYPAAYAGAIAVAATDQSDQRASFSNWGERIDVSAPGTNLLSTLPGDKYGYWFGTSMSTAHVSGVAALLLSQFPSISYDEAISRLKTTVDDLGAVGKDPYFGYGRVNACKAVSGAIVSWSASGLPSEDSVRNGGFEAGSTSSWDVSGYVSIVTAPTQSGSYAVRLGSTGPTGVDSALVQRLDIPSNVDSVALSFWYWVVSDDTLFFDQFTAEFRDLSDNLLASFVRTCENSAKYKSSMFDVSAFKGRTLNIVFRVHDDNYPGDPTYVFLDDISVTWFQGVSLTIGSTNVGVVPPLLSRSYKSGEVISFSVPASITLRGSTYGFFLWNDGNTSPAHPAVTISGDQAFTAYYQTQYAAVIVSHTIPQVMEAGKSYQVSVTVRNTGTNTWTRAELYRLGPVGDTDPLGGPGRVFLDPSDSIATGQTKTFVFTINAPYTSGTYLTRWRMVRERVCWFGETLAVSVSVTITQYAAVIVSHTIPQVMEAGNSYQVSVTVRNTGTNTWTRAEQYKLGDPAGAIFGISRVALEASDSIATSQAKTFTFTMIAPSTPGTHVARWRMVRERVCWFGEALVLYIRVV